MTHDVMQSHELSRGVHIVVATPGKLIDMLEKRRITLDVCRSVCHDSGTEWTSEHVADTSASTRLTA